MDAARSRPDLAAVGADHAIWVRQYQIGKRPGPWRSIGGKTTGDPVIISPSPNTVVALARGTDNAIWYNEFSGRTPGVAAGWHSMHGKSTSGVTAITQAEASQYGRTSVFVLGTDNQPWMKSGMWPALSGWTRVRIDY